MDIEQQNGAADKPSTASPVTAHISAEGLARRRFGKAGIGASGVLLTLVSQPGMASGVCKAPSGSLSGGLISHKGPAVACTGKSPGYWKNHSSWPSSCSTSAKFNSVFYCAGLNQNSYGAAKTTLKLILSHQSFDSSNLGMHMCATYLNIQSGRIGFLTVAELQKIWYDWQRYGYYAPTAGVKWNAAQIVMYLTTTMD
jgi:hypothetical protein